MSAITGGDTFPWYLGVSDAHCHPTDTLASLDEIPNMKAKVLTVMATRAQDQELVAKAADRFGLVGEDRDDVDMKYDPARKIVPAFGWHPWFSHQMFFESDYAGSTSLTSEQKVAHYQSVLSPKSDDTAYLESPPDPRPFEQFLAQTKQYLIKHPLALIGEVGLDKAFRIPENWLPNADPDMTECQCRDSSLTPGGREGRKLSPYRVSMDHQKRVLLAQLALAGEMARAVSMHGVQAHGIVYETLASTWKGHERKKPPRKERRKLGGAAPQDEETIDQTSSPKAYPPRICLHSYSGPADTLKLYLAPSVPCNIFFSFSVTINNWSETGDGKVEAAVRAVPDDRILVESDLHTAGERMDGYLEQGVRKICEVKGWDLEVGVRQLGRNWRRFVFGEG
ncbi:cut9 interacting protein Scn1 [Zymoseptoria brevis]|uniref:Cut9 interacting protein Scn1 n=1 Tax=Zymoseptoria brevis TaxID=1047168 RepID=A0A0F4GJB8_9PEZI|nr:cut9 interacting protein Scn1 [Zymoseptoria brevis]